MKPTVFLAPLLLLALAACAAQPTTAPAETKQSASANSADDVLDMLERSGRDLRTLSADLRLATNNPNLGDSTVQSGKFWLDNGKDGSPRARILFDRKEVGDRVVEQKVEYVLDSGKLIERNYERKQQITRQVLRPGEKMNLLKLGEGPFPLPIGQKRDDVYAAFDVKRIDPAKDDPADTAHIQLIPKPDTSLARKMQTIDVWVNPKDGLPTRIVTLDPGGNEERTVDLKNVQINANVGESELTLSKIGSDWTLMEESFQRDDGKKK